MVMTWKIFLNGNARFLDREEGAVRLEAEEISCATSGNSDEDVRP